MTRCSPISAGLVLPVKLLKGKGASGYLWQRGLMCRLHRGVSRWVNEFGSQRRDLFLRISHNQFFNNINLLFFKTLTGLVRWRVVLHNGCCDMMRSWRKCRLQRGTMCMLYQSQALLTKEHINLRNTRHVISVQKVFSIRYDVLASVKTSSHVFL